MRLSALVLAVSLTSLAPASAAPEKVLVLVTGDENGHVLPNTEADPPKGGAAETLGYWTSKEGSLPGEAGEGRGPGLQGREDAGALHR
jgi:hypothetical protein